MRRILGGLVAAVWLLLSVVLWAGWFNLVPSPSPSHAIGLTESQSVLIAYHLSDVLATLVGAFLSFALGGILSALWLLLEGLMRRVRLAVALGGAIGVLELALALFAYLRVELLLPAAPNAAGLLNGASIAGQIAAEMIPAVLLLAFALGAISLVAPARSPRAERAGKDASVDAQTGQAPLGQGEAAASSDPEEPTAGPGEAEPHSGATDGTQDERG